MVRFKRPAVARENLYRVVQHHLEEFVRHFKWLLTSRDMFCILQETPPHTLTDSDMMAPYSRTNRL